MSDDGSRIYRPVFGSLSGDSYSRLDVYDATQFAPGTTLFVKLGAIPLPDQASGPGSYGRYPALILSELERTLFLVGDQNLLVVPIPAELAPQVAPLRVLGMKRIAE